MKEVPEELIQKIKNSIQEIEFGSIEIILNGKNPDNVDVLTHHRTRFEMSKLDRFHKG